MNHHKSTEIAKQRLICPAQSACDFASHRTKGTASQPVPNMFEQNQPDTFREDSSWTTVIRNAKQTPNPKSKSTKSLRIDGIARVSKGALLYNEWWCKSILVFGFGNNWQFTFFGISSLRFEASPLFVVLHQNRVSDLRSRVTTRRLVENP